MGASICWKPSLHDTRRISTYTPSSFQAEMKRAGMELPCTIGQDDLLVLKGMAAMFSAEPNPYEQLFKLIIEFGKINLWVEY